MYYLQNEWPFFTSVYIYKTRVLCTSNAICKADKNRHEFCKLLLKRTQIVVQ